MYRIRAEGLDELRRDLKGLKDDPLDRRRQVLDAFRDAADIVADEAKRRANTFSFDLSDTIRPGSGMSSRGPTSFVKGGKAAYPWYGWADFGSRNPRTGQPRSVGPWANSGRGPRGGRFIYPAIEAKAGDVVREIERGVDAVLRVENF